MPAAQRPAARAQSGSRCSGACQESVQASRDVDAEGVEGGAGADEGLGVDPAMFPGDHGGFSASARSPANNRRLPDQTPPR